MKAQQKFKLFQLIIYSWSLILGTHSALSASSIVSREHVISQIIETANIQAVAPAPFLLGIARIESNFQRVSLSNQGDIGIFQLDQHLVGNHKNMTSKSLKDEVSLSVALINRLFKKYKGNKYLVLSELKSDGKVGGWPNNRIIPDESSYIYNVLEAEKIFQTMLNGFGRKTKNDSHFYLQLSNKNNSNPTFLTATQFKSDWPVWKKELYFVKHLLTEDLSYTEFEQLQGNRYVSRLNSSKDFVGSSKINLNEDDF